MFVNFVGTTTTSEAARRREKGHVEAGLRQGPTTFHVVSIKAHPKQGLSEPWAAAVQAPWANWRGEVRVQIWTLGASKTGPDVRDVAKTIFLQKSEL